MSEAARSHRSDLRVEPYLELPSGKRSDASGPLAELAQIVGQDDPFRAMFRPSKSSMRPVTEPVMTTDAHDDAFAGHETEGEAAYAEAGDHITDTQTLGLRPSQHDEPDWAPAEAHDEQWQDGYDHAEAPASHDGYHSEQPVHEAEDMPIDAPHYVAPPLTPDLWANPADEADNAPPLSDEAAAEARTPRRPLVVLMAVLALTGGGLAATFLSRSGSGAIASLSGASAAPTILAASGPTKIKQTDTASDTTPEDADAALLSKNGASSGGTVRVVNSQEQPIDLGQLPKSAGGQADAPSSTGSSPFPEPKKVKTFLVRPDGSLVNSSNPAAAQAPVRSLVPQLAIGGTDAAPPPAPVSRPSTPKTGGHAATTPKAPPASIAELTAADGADTAKAQQPASPGARSGSGSKPVEAADASAADATATTNPSGNFALQLAASPSEQDARSAFTRLQKKYSELGSFQPTVKKVDTGQKTIYRLRVGNLSQDQAKTLCSQLQASGGSCFVVHN